MITSLRGFKSKFLSVLMIAVVLLVGSFAVNQNSASAYSGTTYFTVEGYNHSLKVSDDSSNVYVTLKQTEASNLYNWKMELQRANSNDAWVTIGTRYGYVDYYSSSSRTFTSVRKDGSPMLVRVTFMNRYTGAVVAQKISNIWIR